MSPSDDAVESIANKRAASRVERPASLAMSRQASCHCSIACTPAPPTNRARSACSSVLRLLTLAAVVLCFLVVPNPEIVVQIGRRGHAELRWTIHGPGRDVANPGRCRRQVPRRGRLPHAGSRLWWLPGRSGVAAVIGSQL